MLVYVCMHMNVHINYDIHILQASVQFSHSVVSNCDPMDCSIPGLPVEHQLP